MMRFFLTSLTLAAAAYAQDVVSARAGMIQFIEGAVEVDGKAIEMPAREKMFSQLPEVKKGSVLSTTGGRAEILMSPGVTLRLGEEAAFKMVDSDLGDTKIELQKGAAVVEVLELVKGNMVTVFVDKAYVTFRKAGTYKFHVNAGSAPEVMVYEGQAEVTIAGQTKSVKRGNVMVLESALAMRKFDTEKGDALLRWSLRRSGYMAMANVSAASSARSMGYSGNGRMGGWMWNQYYGMYTYLPYNGMFCNNYLGTCYYSPSSVYRAFYAPSYGGGNNGAGASMGGYTPTSYGYDSNRGYTVASGDRSYGGLSSGASSSVGAPAAAAPVADSGGGRSGGDSGGRGGEGGGRAQ